MAKKTAKKKLPPKKKNYSLPPETAGIALLILALLTALSFLSVSRSFLTEGWVQLFRFLFGWGSYLAPVWLALLGFWLLRGFSGEVAVERWEKPLGAFVLFLIMLGFFELFSPVSVSFWNLGESSGGLAGHALAGVLQAAFGAAGAFLILLVLSILALILISGLSLSQALNSLIGAFQRLKVWLEERRKAEPSSPLAFSGKPQANWLSPLKGEDSSLTIKRPGESKSSGPGRLAASPAPMEELTVYPRPPSSAPWQLPKIDDILNPAEMEGVSDAEILQRAKIIEDTLNGFSTPVRVLGADAGPTITRFNVEPGYLEKPNAPGERQKVRVNRIASLANDLALALSASPIRIEAPVPGEPYVGIEVPNSHISLVSLHGVLAGEEFRKSRQVLTFGLGRDVAGQPVFTDLTRLPHLLIAGTTNSGKSVCINTIICTLLLTHTPDTLRFIMIDPKVVELVAYNGIPHLLAPVVTDLEQVVGVLSWAVREMERRYKLFAASAVRNIAGYNARFAPSGDHTLPYITIVVDELADLMMIAPDEVERLVTRIAQMARATGIHLIIATQRPSTEIITGLIKANFPARISFAVASQIDSRVILDAPGAERLLGRGDMLYMAPDSSKLVRLQGAYVSDEEISRLVRYWKGPQGPPAQPAGETPTEGEKPAPVQQRLWEEAQERMAEMAALQKSDSEDELLAQAIEIVRQQGRASATLLQRRMRLGYARAARLIDLMEAKGIIGPDLGGGRGREVVDAETPPDEEDDPAS